MLVGLVVLLGAGFAPGVGTREKRKVTERHYTVAFGRVRANEQRGLHVVFNQRFVG